MHLPVSISAKGIKTAAATETTTQKNGPIIMWRKTPVSLDSPPPLLSVYQHDVCGRPPALDGVQKAGPGTATVLALALRIFFKKNLRELSHESCCASQPVGGAATSLGRFPTPPAPPPPPRRPGSPSRTRRKTRRAGTVRWKRGIRAYICGFLLSLVV